SPPSDAGRTAFESRCARCHGADAMGGEHGPDIVHAPTARALTEGDLRKLIRTGIPAAGMPAFELDATELSVLARYVHALLAPAAGHPSAGNVAAGEQFFWGKGGCGACHMIHGRGSVAGPDLTELARI